MVSVNLKKFVEFFLSRKLFDNEVIVGIIVEKLLIVFVKVVKFLFGLVNLVCV